MRTDGAKVPPAAAGARLPSSPGSLLPAPALTLFRNVRLFDGMAEASSVTEVLVEGDRIIELSDRAICSAAAEVVDVHGAVLMPGLIDAHAHPCLTEIDGAAQRSEAPSLNTARAIRSLGAMLDRGFTTIRDAGGCDWGLRQAVADGIVRGPRIFISGRALSQTAGHGDLRDRIEQTGCGCGQPSGIASCIADGETGVRKAVREQLRMGADQIKVMISGGVSSPVDPLESCQYSVGELAAIVDEATRWGTYVMAHAYTPAAIRHGLAAGVRSFEHANLIDAATATAVAAAGAYVVPTLVTYAALSARRGELALTDAMVAKLERVLDAGQQAVAHCAGAGVSLGFGTDLLGDMQDWQANEFLLRARVQPLVDVLRSATSVNAALLCQSGQLGVVAVGARADLLVVEGDPMADPAVLAGDGRNLRMIMKDGRFHKRPA